MNLIDANNLFTQGAIAFAEIETHGIGIDEDYCNKKIAELTEKQNSLISKFASSEIGFAWKKRYQIKSNFQSRQQMAVVMEKDFNEKLDKSDKGNSITDSDVLKKLSHKYESIKYLAESKKINHVLNTFFVPIIEEAHNGRLHFNLNLNTTRSYRSSSSNINFQNIPAHDPIYGKVIRHAFIPTEGFLILEVDFSNIEVRIATCYHKDPNMIEYMHDMTKDMHRDLAQKIFKLSRPEHVSKNARFVAKNSFTFAQFYGDYYVNCANNILDSIHEYNVMNHKNIPILDHLVEKGITTREEFIEHIRAIEDFLWNKFFPVYGQWREDWKKAYHKNGFMDTLTGFRISGDLSNNQITNLPIQGSAFHCLLWSLIKIHTILKDKKFRSKIIGQIHDSIVFDVWPDELDDVIKICERIMTKTIKKHWDWIIVPMLIEAEKTEINKSWATKTKI